MFWLYQIVSKLKFYNAELANFVSSQVIQTAVRAFDNNNYARIAIDMCIFTANSFDYELFRPLFAEPVIQELVDRICD